MSKFIQTVQNLTFRKWLYGVLMALLVFFASQGTITAVQQENLGNLINAILLAAPAAGFALAIRKVEPAASDDTLAITEDDVDEVPLEATFTTSSVLELDAPVTDSVQPTALPGKHAAPTDTI